ncbi:MAG: universal stress protein [Acidobacteriota bacterium]
MPRRAMQRLYQTVTGAAQRRDEIEMDSINRLLSPLVPAPAPATRRASTKRVAGGGFRSVLCPVDFSAHSRRALQYAALIARRSQGRLAVLYVNDPLLVAAAGIALNDRALAARNLAELRRFVRSTISPADGERARFDEFVATGQPVAEITKAAARRRCDLIVMGAHGLTAADKLLFIGSTTQGVLQRTSVPVLAIPGGDPTSVGAPAPGPSWPGSPVIAAVELDRRTKRDARAAVAVAHLFAATVLLVHVVPELRSPPWLRKRLGTTERARITHAQAGLEAVAAGLRRQGDIETRIVLGDATRDIARLAATERASLVILTLRTPRDWFGPRRGSISFDVLSQVTTPVLALPG